MTVNATSYGGASTAARSSARLRLAKDDNLN